MPSVLFSGLQVQRKYGGDGRMEPLCVPLALSTLIAPRMTCFLLLKNTYALGVKGTYFLIISLLVYSYAVVKETEASEKLFSFPVGGGLLCHTHSVCGNGPVLL